MTFNDVFQILGYVMVVGGIALYSVGAALIVGGLALFIGGGIAAAREGGRR